MRLLLKNTLWALVFFCINGYAQSPKIDSLYKKLKETLADTTKAKVYFNLGMNYKRVDPDSAIHYLKKAIHYSEELEFSPMIVLGYTELGDFYKQEYNLLDTCIAYVNKALDHTGNQTDQRYFNIYNVLGSAYFLKGNYIKAYDFFLKYLNKVEAHGTPNQIAKAYNNVGSLLKEQKKFNDALIFYNKGLVVALKSDNQKILPVLYLNIGNVYSELSNNGKSVYHTQMALENYLKAKELLVGKDGKRDMETMAVLLGNIGNIYADLKQFDKAVDEFKKAVKLLDELEDFIQASLIYNNFAAVYIDLKNTKEAEKYLKLAYATALVSESPDDMMQNYMAYSRLYEVEGKWKDAYMYQFRYKQISDSLFSTENAEKRKELELNAEFEKKETEAKLIQDKKEAVANEEKQKQRIILYAFVFGFILMIIVAFLVFRSYRIKKKSNEIITQQKLEVEKQKELVEEKQKEILDSIHYAKRIQLSLLPTKKYIDRNLSKLKDKEKI